MSDLFHEHFASDEAYLYWRARQEEPMPERNFDHELAEANHEQSRWLFWNCIDQLEDYFGAGRKVLSVKTHEAFPSKYLKGDEIKGRPPVKVTISHVAMEDIGDGEMKLVMYFKGKKRGMVANRTNIDVIAERYGDEMDDWTDKDLELFHDPNVNFQGKRVGGLRVRVPLPPEAEQGSFDDSEF